jgi:hypothetical protein
MVMVNSWWHCPFLGLETSSEHWRPLVLPRAPVPNTFLRVSGGGGFPVRILRRLRGRRTVSPLLDRFPSATPRRALPVLGLHAIQRAVACHCSGLARLNFPEAIAAYASATVSQLFIARISRRGWRGMRTAIRGNHGPKRGRRPLRCHLAARPCPSSHSQTFSSRQRRTPLARKPFFR